MPDSNIRDVLISCLAVGKTDIATLQQSVASWFDSAMGRLSGQYTRSAQKISLVIGVVLAIGLGADSYGVAQKLWLDTGLREELADAAEKFVLNPPASAEEKCKKDDEPKPDAEAKPETETTPDAGTKPEADTKAEADAKPEQEKDRATEVSARCVQRANGTHSRLPDRLGGNARRRGRLALENPRLSVDRHRLVAWGALLVRSSPEVRQPARRRYKASKQSTRYRERLRPRRSVN